MYTGGVSNFLNDNFSLLLLLLLLLLSRRRLVSLPQLLLLQSPRRLQLLQRLNRQQQLLPPHLHQHQLQLALLLPVELLDELLSCAATGRAINAVIAKLVNSFFINLVLLQKYKIDIPQFFAYINLQLVKYLTNN